MSERGVKLRGGRMIGEDRISFFPDHLLCEILSHLPTKVAVRTCVLSKRWKSLWLSVPLLDLGVEEFRAGYSEFARVLHSFLDISRETRIHKLILYLKRNQRDQSYLTQWIYNAVMLKVQHLDINICSASYVGTKLMPLCLYTCETLVSLKLYHVALPDFENVSLPRLKIMHLNDNIYTSDALLENLISSCPVLEDLKVFRYVGIENVVKVLRVRSQSLKSLQIFLHSVWYQASEDDDCKVVIDAPGLSCLNLEDHCSKSFVISSLTSPVKALRR